MRLRHFPLETNPVLDRWIRQQLRDLFVSGTTGAIALGVYHAEKPQVGIVGGIELVVGPARDVETVVGFYLTDSVAQQGMTVSAHDNDVVHVCVCFQGGVPSRFGFEVANFHRQALGTFEEHLLGHTTRSAAGGRIGFYRNILPTVASIAL